MFDLVGASGQTAVLTGSVITPLRQMGLSARYVGFLENDRGENA